MNENNEQNRTSDIPENDEFFYIPDYSEIEIDAEGDEQQVIERISDRKSNTKKYVAPDMNFFQKLDEFWYRNKSLIIMGLFAAVVLIYAGISSLPKKYDIDTTIYVSSSDFPSTIQFEMVDEVEAYSDDWNGTGEVEIY